MRTPLKLAAAMIALCAATPANASDWRVGDYVTDSTMFLVDAESLVSNAIWAATVETKPSSMVEDPAGTVKLMRIRINCKEATARLEFVRSYDDAQAVTEETSTPGDWFAVIPDTPGQGVYDFVCKAETRSKWTSIYRTPLAAREIFKGDAE